MLKLGLVSDTHAYLDPQISSYFEAVDEIWHAGDIGSLAILEELETFKPVKAVFGNIDKQTIRLASNNHLCFETEGFRILLFHYGGKQGYYDKRAYTLLKKYKPQIFIHGHSHICRIYREPMFNSMLVINPGAAGKHGFQKIRTICRLTLNQGKIEHLEVVELGLRGSIS